MSHLPELLGCVLSCYALQDLCTAGVFVDEVGYVEDVAVDDDVEAFVGGVVGGHVGGGECLGHNVGLELEIEGEGRVEERRG